jgi:hypothetical protein
MRHHNSGSHEGRGGERYKVITRSSKENGDEGETVYIKTDRNGDKEIEKTIDIYVSDNDNDSKVEKTRYVIAKDGMVVTIEGSDDARIKELVKEIQTKLGIKNDETEKKEILKSESKKVIKK